MGRDHEGCQALAVLFTGRNAVSPQGVLRIRADGEVGPGIGRLQRVALQLHGAAAGKWGSRGAALPQCGHTLCKSREPLRPWARATRNVRSGGKESPNYSRQTSGKGAQTVKGSMGLGNGEHLHNPCQGGVSLATSKCKRKSTRSLTKRPRRGCANFFGRQGSSGRTLARRRLPDSSWV